MMKIIIGIAIIACIAPFFIKGPSGEPMMTLSDWQVSLPSSFRDFIADLKPDSIPAESAADDENAKTLTTVYKWQDENGQWQFSSTPPNTMEAESIEISNQINTMPAVELPKKADQEMSPGTSGGSLSALSGGAMTASPDQVKQMIDTVTRLQETVDQRKADIDAVAGFDK